MRAPETGRVPVDAPNKRAAWWLTAAIAGTGLVVYVSQGWRFDLGAALSNPWMWLLAAAFFVSEIYTIDLPFKKQNHSYSLSEIASVIGLFYLAPDELVFAAVVGMACDFAFLRRQRGLKLAFNLALQFTVTVLMIMVFYAISLSRDPTEASALIAAFAAVAVNALVSHTAVNAVISLVEGAWNQFLFMRGLGLGFATQLTNASLGLIGVVLLEVDWRAIFILLTPIAVIFGAYRSLGERIRVQEQLRASERRSSALIKASSDVTALVKPDGTVQFMSEAAVDVLGIEPAACVGEVAWALVRSDPEDVASFRKCFEEALSTEDPVVFGIGARHADGVPIELEVSLTNLQSDPDVDGILMSIRDTTERRRLEESLAQSQKMDAIGQLAGGIAHDFNNLLAVIQNYATFIRDELPADSESRSDVEGVLQATDAASKLTRQLLSFARREVVMPKVVDMNEVVSGLHRLLARTFEESVELRISLSPDLPRVKVDPGRVEQALVNLALNAKDAMPAGGHLQIRTYSVHIGEFGSSELPEGDYAAIAVQDFGVGIPPETRERIFEPFFTTKRKGEGTGLGLATAYGIVKQFGGHITFDSVVGEGTTFYIYLPATEELEDGHEERADDGVAPAGGTILVAEDSEALRNLVRRILTNNAYEVIVASSGADAYELWKKRKDEIDLLLTDVVMPKMSGRELADLTGLRTVFMSGYTDQIISQEQVAEGAGFIRKPFSAEDLLATVARALSTEPPPAPATRRVPSESRRTP